MSAPGVSVFSGLVLAGGEGSFTVRTIRSAEFSYETAIERLVSLDKTISRPSEKAGGMVTRDEDQEALDANIRRMRLSTIIDTDCRLSVITSEPLTHTFLMVL